MDWRRAIPTGKSIWGLSEDAIQNYFMASHVELISNIAKQWVFPTTNNTYHSYYSGSANIYRLLLSSRSRPAALLLLEVSVKLIPSNRRKSTPNTNLNLMLTSHTLTYTSSASSSKIVRPHWYRHQSARHKSPHDKYKSSFLCSFCVVHQEVCIGLQEPSLRFYTRVLSLQLYPLMYRHLPNTYIHTDSHTLHLRFEDALQWGGCFRPLAFHMGVYLLCLHCDPNAIHLSRWPIVFIAIHIWTQTHTTSPRAHPARNLQRIQQAISTCAYGPFIADSFLWSASYILLLWLWTGAKPCVHGCVYSKSKWEAENGSYI